MEEREGQTVQATPGPPPSCTSKPATNTWGTRAAGPLMGKFSYSLAPRLRLGGLFGAQVLGSGTAALGQVEATFWPWDPKLMGRILETSSPIRCFHAPFQFSLYSSKHLALRPMSCVGSVDVKVL
jgi:hypothetical protein